MKLGKKKKSGGFAEALKNFVLEQVKSGTAAGAGKAIQDRPSKIKEALKKALGEKA